MPAYIINMAQNLWKNKMGEPSDVSIPSICAYFRANIGELNNLLGTSFQLNNVLGTPNYLELINGQNTGCLIDIGAAAVYSQLFLIDYYQRMVKNFTSIGDINLIVQASSDEGTLRFTDRGQLGRLYLDMKKDAETVLNKMVNKYKMRHQTALDVTGDDVYVYDQGNGAAGVPYMQDII
jgi:hypothetical protein